MGWKQYIYMGLQKWRDNKAYYAALTICTLVGLALRLYHSDIRTPWLDEIHTYQVVNGNPGFLAMMRFWWSSFAVSDPPLYYILNFATVGGDLYASFLALRAVSILFGVGAIPLMAVLARQVTGSRLIAAGAAILMALNTYAIQYSQEYRPYSQLLFFSLLYMVCQVAVIRRFSGKRFTALAIASLLLIYTHYFGGFTLAAGYIAWGICLAKAKFNPRHATWAFMALPFILGLLYIPIIGYGVGQAKHYSVSSGSGSPADAILQMYLNQKKHTNFWTDLLPTFNTYYLSKSTPAATVLFYLAAIAGLSGLLLKFPKTAFLLAGATIANLVLNYVFYEVMKYPYEPRRSIGILPINILLMAAGIGIPLLMAPRFAAGRSGIIARISTIMLFAGAACLLAMQFIRYDALGYQRQGNQTDWTAITDLVKANARPDEVIGIYSAPGNTWYSSQYNFFHTRARISNRQQTIGSVNDLKRIFQDSNTKGIWFPLCLPFTENKELRDLLRQKGQWKAYFGGALVYLPRSAFYSDGSVSRLFVPRNGFYALTVEGIKKDHIPVSLISPSQAEVTLTAEKPYAVLPFALGTQEYTFSTTETLTTTTLAPVLSNGRWNDAKDIFDWTQAGDTPDIVLDKNRSLALYMLYNGAAVYRFYLPAGGEYALTLEATHDVPGPVRGRVYFKGIGEIEKYVFDKQDNRPGQVTHNVRLREGLNEMAVYYDSFKRIEAPGAEYDDTINQFIFSRWKLTRLNEDRKE